MGTVTPDPVAWLFDVIWMALLGAVGVVVAMVKAKLNRVEARADAAVTQAELKEATTRRDKETDRLRADIKELFLRDDNIKDYITEQITDLRTDMHEQFNRLSELLRTK